MQLVQCYSASSINVDTTVVKKSKNGLTIKLMRINKAEEKLKCRGPSDSFNKNR